MRHPLVVMALFAVLSGCGVTIESKRIAESKPKTLIQGEGIVYALPKTELSLVQPVKLTVPTGGILQDVYGDCKRACEAAAPNVGSVCQASGRPKAKFLPPEVRATAVPDPTRLYQVSPSADIFQTLTVSFEIASNGVLDKADSSSTNLGYEVVTSFVNAAIKIGSMASHGPSPLKLPKPAAAARTCYQVSADVATLADNQGGLLTCSLAKEIEACLAPLDDKVEAERAELDKIYQEARARKIDPKVLASLAEHQSRRIAKATEDRNEAASRFGFGQTPPKVATFEITIPMGAPLEFRDFDRIEPLGQSVRSGSARIAGLTDEAASLLPALITTIQDSPRNYVVASRMPADVLKTDEKESEVVGKGYHYRIPTSAVVELKVFDGPPADGKLLAGPLRDSKVIAQYGPVAALPSSFKGKQGRVMVKHWPETGGLQTVEIGAEGVPTSAVTGVVDELVAQQKARKEKADAAAAADAELDALTRQEKILALKQLIKEHEDALKN